MSGTLRNVLEQKLAQTLAKFNIGLLRHSTLQKLARDSNDLDLLLRFPTQHSPQLLRSWRMSKSQVKQDLFVLSELGFKRNGFFVEFGATNGVYLSNTYLLEKEFGWSGILAEPARCWHKELSANRDCQVTTECVWRDSNSILTFNEVDNAELSTIDSYSSTGAHLQARKRGKTYDVRTVSLEDLLDKCNAPKDIDYLSIDTEGSEYEILRSFNFDRYQFKIITCEHGFESVKRENIVSLLTKHGYVRKCEELSSFDDWFVRVE